MMNKEEVKYLREHIEGICRYKGLQQELAYDVSLDVLQRICVALDYLQQENEYLRKQITEYQDEIFARDNNYYDMQD